MQSHWLAARLLLTAIWRRTLTNPLPVIALLFALVLPLTLGLTVPSYADAAGVRILNQELTAQSRKTQRPAMALLYRYVKSNKIVPWRTIIGADTLITQTAPQYLQYPIARITSHIRTIPLRVMLVSGSQNGIPLDNAPLATLVGMQEYMKYVSGRAPQPNSDIEIAISQHTANTYGLNLADTLVLSSSVSKQTLTCMIVGIWTPLQPDSEEWLYAPDTLADLLLVAPQTMQDVVSATFPDTVAQAAWYIQPQPFMLAPGEIWQVEQRIRTLSQELAKGSVKLERSPLVLFESTQTIIQSLTERISIIALLIALLALLFIFQLANISYQRRQDEFILLRSRGVQLRWFIGVSIAEWFAYILIATLIAIPLSIFATQIMLRTDSFLHLTAISAPLSGLPYQSWLYLLIIAIIIVLLALLPVRNVFQSTLSQNIRNRSYNRLHIFGRVIVAVIVSVGVGYGYYGLYIAPDVTQDVFTSSMTLILPVCNAIAISLIANLCIPLFLKLSEKIARRGKSLALILALQTLSRRSAQLQTTVMMLTITLGVGGYVASMAATIDTASQNGLAYRIATDTQLIESAISSKKPNEGDRYLITPLGAHKQLPGIIAYAPVGLYDGQVNIGGTAINTAVVAIDRTRFLQVIPHFEDAWLGAGNSFGAILNQLALYRNGVIIDKSIAGNSAIGDKIAVTLTIDDVTVDVQMRIVAMVTGWPGQYSADRPYVVMNLNFVADEVGFIPPNDVWVRRDTTIPLDELLGAARNAAIPIINTIDFHETRLIEFTRPERQGLFGMLTIGFIAAAALTVMAILVSALATMRQRNIELGMLQAMGMPRQTARHVIILEQSITTISGLGCGLIAAVVCATSILPALPAGVAPHRNVPISTPITAWSTLAVMLILYALAVVVTMWVAFFNNQQLRIADAIKLGDEN